MPLPPSFPELRNLDLFASVVRFGSVSQAAAAHGISQPSASSRMSHLERQVGLPLLERRPTGSVPTDAGRLVAQWAENVLAAAADLNVGLDALRARRTHRLRVSASFTVAEYLLPGWLQRFHAERPDLGVELEVANSAAVLRHVRDGSADLGFVESPGELEGLHSKTVGHDELVAVFSPGHQWASRRSLPASVVAVTPLVLREQGSGTREAFEDALVAAGLGRPIAALELGSTAAIKLTVASGGDPAVLSAVAVAGDVEIGRLRARPVDGLELRRPLRAVWRSDRALSEAAEDLLAVAEAPDRVAGSR